MAIRFDNRSSNVSVRNTNSQVIKCQNCQLKFSTEDALIIHYQNCLNNIHNVNEVINFINVNSMIQNQLKEANPFIPDNLNEYIDWELIKNEDTGINNWIQKQILTPSSK